MTITQHQHVYVITLLCKRLWRVVDQFNPPPPSVCCTDRPETMCGQTVDSSRKLWTARGSWANSVHRRRAFAARSGQKRCVDKLWTACGSCGQLAGRGPIHRNDVMTVTISSMFGQRDLWSRSRPFSPLACRLTERVPHRQRNSLE